MNRPALAPLPKDALVTRNSPLHGRGVFATRRIAAGTPLLEYKGERITMKEALRRYPEDPDPYHTFLFELEDGSVIDATHTRCQTRWINHSCDPNCEAVERDGRIWIEALRDIRPGEELAYDYGFVLEERHSPAVKRRYPCWCRTTKCRGTMLARKG